MLINTPSERSCIVSCIACEIDQLKVTRSSSSSTACCVLSAALPFPVSTLSDFNCVTMESCTFVKHLDRPAAWLHITDCSQNALSHLLKASWLKVREAGAEGKLHLATLVKVLLSLAGYGDQSHTVVQAESFFPQCIAYHFDDLGVFTGRAAVHQSQSSWKDTLEQELHSVSQIFWTAIHLPLT